LLEKNNQPCFYYSLNEEFINRCKLNIQSENSRPGFYPTQAIIENWPHASTIINKRVIDVIRGGYTFQEWVHRPQKDLLRTISDGIRR
jgi:hypothetical protein